jgi:hypothetical protein
MSLLMTALTAGLLAALGISVLIVGDVERRAAANAATSLSALAAADGALERALVDVRDAPTLDPLLTGAVKSTWVDGTRRPQLPGGGSIDLDAATADLQRQTNAEVNLGADTPQWQLFAWGSMADASGAAASSSRAYLAAWVADDAGETDGNPRADRNGRISVHAEAYAGGGMRRAVEATVERSAVGSLRMTMWREVR